MQGFNENRTTISLLKVLQVSTMHAQRKEPEKNLRLEENNVCRKKKKKLSVLMYSQHLIGSLPRPFHPAFVLVGKGKDSKGDAVGRI